MATSYTSLLGLALPATGELSGTWGDTVNNYISNYLDSAVAGSLTLTADTTLTKTTNASLGATSSQYAIIIASPTSAAITITAPAASKTYVVNNTSGTYSVTFKATGQSGVSIQINEKCVLAFNGTDFVKIASTVASGSLANCTVDGTNSVGYLNIPQNAQTGSYTTVLSDAGKHIYHASGAGAATYTIAANASVAYAIGTVISFVNLSSTSISIAINSDTLYLGNLGTTGTRTLAQYGVANALKVTSTAWIITGTALT
jgi:hypothetical protein